MIVTNEKMNSHGQTATGVRLGISEALLRSEIGFWREMIESCQKTEPPDSIERMHYALALAESKLEKPPCNVYHIDEARGARK